MRCQVGLRRLLATTLILLPCVVVWPSRSALGPTKPWLAAPLDPSLRVPFASALIGAMDPSFESGDRVLDVSVSGESRVLTPRTRAELYRSLARVGSARSVSMHLVRNRGRVTVEAEISREPGWRRAARAWPMLFLGFAFLAFGLTIVWGSRHPVATPLFALSWCIGAHTLSHLDLLFPEDAGLLGIGLLRSRLATLSLMFLPAAVLHLAMRFPVVSQRFRNPAIAALPYGFWLLPAAFTQFHVDDAAFLNSVERVTLGATFVTSGILAIASATYARTMAPIERARTLALLVGLGAGAAVPFASFVGIGTPPQGTRVPLTLSLLVLPAAISWAIVRYRLLDPPRWLQRAVLGGLSALVALLVATGVVGLSLSFLEAPSIFASAEVVPVALLTTLLYQLLQLGLRRGAGHRVLGEGGFERFLEEASRELARARSREAVLDRVAQLIRAHLQASRVEWLAPGQSAPVGAATLGSRGLALWRHAGSPRHHLVRSRSRDEDPGPDVAEVVVPLMPVSIPAALVVVGSRLDGLPYTDEQERMIESLLHVATTALEAATTAADLEARVAEKTARLEQALGDRQAVLRAARAICEADRPEEVEATLRSFAAAQGAMLRAEPGEESWGGEHLAAPGQPPQGLVARGIPPERVAEVAPQLDTLCAFAGLAIARLDLLAELKREVERQAAEIAEITSRRLHAEFVRGVAHELRKPTEEVRRGVEQLRSISAASVSKILAQVGSASREMSRRLDLLLFHSGIRLDRQRFDLVRVVDDALDAVRAAHPDRDYRLEHELVRLPVVGDPSRLLSVAENLLDNAAKATQPGQRITVRTFLEIGDVLPGPRVRLEVEDEGRGIEADRLDRIFEPGVAFAPSGFGLGLSLCREIVRMHGGAIEVESRPGRTLFRIRLPQFSGRLGEDHGSDGIDPPG